MDKLPDVVPPVSTLLDEIESATGEGNWKKVNATWVSTHLLTNGIFRIASSVEKLVTLKLGLKESERSREQFWPFVRNKVNGLFHDYLGRQKVKWTRRGDYLDREAQRFSRSGGTRAVRYPLLSCIFQSDADKHRVKAPMPNRVRYLAEIACKGIAQAVELYNSTVPASIALSPTVSRSRNV